MTVTSLGGTSPISAADQFTYLMAAGTVSTVNPGANRVTLQLSSTVTGTEYFTLLGGGGGGRRRAAAGGASGRCQRSDAGDAGGLAPSDGLWGFWEQDTSPRFACQSRTSHLQIYRCFLSVQCDGSHT